MTNEWLEQRKSDRWIQTWVYGDDDDMLGFRRVANERGDGAGVFTRNVNFVAAEREGKTTAKKRALLTGITGSAERIML